MAQQPASTSSSSDGKSSIKKEVKVCKSSKWGVEKSILSEQWKVEGDDVCVSC
jgi:hypothetical protein